MRVAALLLAASAALSWTVAVEHVGATSTPTAAVLAVAASGAAGPRSATARDLM